ncbi:hypothetical protein KL86PLE_41326 [uncultured Pleomorphomonas sp.]|uniref:Uncharacterized protein n=1 Tax=uncultured Pleomorphomonas sp. TaxID=442121 RepID=A0A212LIZ6_9HYPH|nr:hypothetical protein KL86PLE_41326 [uncultured Pleomorphomonas sp.]
MLQDDVVGVHRMEGEAQLLHAVEAVARLHGRRDEDAVAAAADVVVLDEQARRVPDVDARAHLGAVEIGAADDGVAADGGVDGALHVDADQVHDDAVALDAGAAGALGERDAAVELVEPAAGAGNVKPLQRHVVGVNGNDGALAIAGDPAVAIADQRQRPVDDDGAVVAGIAEPEDIPRRGGFDGLAERVRRVADSDLGGTGGTGTTKKHSDKETERARHDLSQTALGFTIMRPRISMWRAWQNHWQ